MVSEADDRAGFKGLNGCKGNMQGVHNYNMLSSQTYCDKFMYIPHSLAHRSQYIVSMYKNSDLRKVSVELIRYASDLAYVPTEHAKSLEFNPEALYKDQKSQAKKDV